MKYKTAAAVSQVVMQMKLADLPRSQNRALIDELFNGEPPYSQREAEENRIDVNVNFLEGAKAAHKARQQFSNAFLSTSRYFKVTVDYGPAHKRQEWSEIITAEINKRMKKSRHYRETLRNVFGQVVLHGVGPATWDDPQKWIPDMQMLSDVMVPSKTLLTFENMDHFAVYRRYNAARLMRKISGPHVDRGWNVKLAEQCIAWAREQIGKATPSGNDQIYSPERLAEDLKSDQGLYSSDAVPTIDCWDFFYYDDETDPDQPGWRRKIILDSPVTGSELKAPIVEDGKQQFLYDASDRIYATKLDRMAHFQVADGNQVAPFRYHSVRSLGWLLYAVCHLQNRLRCKFNEHVFENMLQYFRTADVADAERAIKIDLIDKGVIPPGVQLVPQTERWQINQSIVDMAMQLNRQSMQDSSSSYTQDYEGRMQGGNEKTATEVMAEVNASSALVGSMLSEAYGNQEFQYQEIGRRFCIPDSSDIDVKAFRAACLRQGVPTAALNIDCWQISAERVMGAGNKQLEVAQSKALLEVINRIDPRGQRIVLRNYVFAVTSDPAFTDEVIPMVPEKVTNSVHDAQLASGALMMGLPVGVKSGYNHVEYIATLLAAMATSIQQIEQVTPGMATPQQVMGLQNTAQHIEQHLNILAMEDSEKPRVKEFADELGKLMNIVKGYQQRLTEQREAQQQNEQAEAMAKVETMIAQAKAKIEIMQQQHMQKMEQRQQEHEQKMSITMREARVQEAATDLKLAADIKRQDAMAASKAKTNGESDE